MKMDHINKNLLELFALDPDALRAEQRRTIESHLRTCALCREEHAGLVRMYESLDKQTDAPASERDRLVASRILGSGEPKRRVSGLLGTGQLTVLDRGQEITAGSPRFPERVFAYISTYPLRSAAATLAFTSLVIALLFLTASKDRNPVAGEFKNNTFSVYNRSGELLWTKSARGMPDGSIGEFVDGDGYTRKYSEIVDIDGDGSHQILICGNDKNAEFAADTLYCFDTDGSLRWRSGVGKMIPMGFKGEANHTNSIIRMFLMFKRTPAEPQRLFVIALDRYFSPTKIIELDPRTGAFLQVYFNRGQLNVMDHLDVDGDGREELVIGGVNDAYNRACLVGLDPQSFGGYSPAPSEFGGAELERGREKFYLLFPRPAPLRRVSDMSYNVLARILRKDGGGLVVSCREFISGMPETRFHAGFVYSIDPDLHISFVTGDDNVARVNNYLLSTGAIKHSLIPGMYQSLKDSVLYWDGMAFKSHVATPTRVKNQ